MALLRRSAILDPSLVSGPTAPMWSELLRVGEEQQLPPPRRLARPFTRLLLLHLNETPLFPLSGRIFFASPSPRREVAGAQTVWIDPGGDVAKMAARRREPITAAA